MCELLTMLIDSIKYDLLGYKRRAVFEYHSREDAKAIRKADRHPKHRELVGFMERRQWAEVGRILSEDHEHEQFFTRLPGAVLHAVYLHLYRPPLDLVLDYMVSEYNATHFYLSASLSYVYFYRAGPVDRVYLQHALLRHFRPDELVIFKPKLIYNPDTEEYVFKLHVSTRDPRLQLDLNMHCSYNIFLGYPCYTYSLLTEAGFKASPLEYYKTSNFISTRGYSGWCMIDSSMSKDMIAYCQQHERNCASLLYMCRNTIRRSMFKLDRRYFQQLKLPKAVEKFLTLENVDCPVFRKYTGKPFPKLEFRHF